MDRLDAGVRNAAPETTDLEAAKKDLQERLPAAHIWYVREHDGHTKWILQLDADSPEHLEEALREIAADAGMVAS